LSTIYSSLIINCWSCEERGISNIYYFMTTVYCFSTSHHGGNCSRAILVEPSESVHHVTYSPRHFLNSYFTWILCSFITTLLKYSFPLGTYSALSCTFALHGVRLLCSRARCLYWQITVFDGRECSWPVQLGCSPITFQRRYYETI